ncbi:DUF72 domain-containing protein [Sphingomonas sp. NFR15]|uniref:DUF72 domain-containing protein n=1 Tax=Sphingomonas sp. NFR15 TaxID=1566282 RepID=UPI00088440F2|nr:DUF72 domain-containing protein [Sphingomonas sp. NFR15]SDA35559.1 Uncharacterized conserved protein YecE, DUF72 family [Sphingomonas sp. NFR15]
MVTGTAFRIGTAGWAISAATRGDFPAQGSGLERYAARLGAVEINSTFYRPHRPSTFARWAASVPADFRFAVKLPKTITHGARLVGCDDLLSAFAGQIAPLAEHLGPLLVQLPPSLVFDRAVAVDFFATLARTIPARAVCEPRHPSWFEPEADALLAEHHIARVAADPALCEAAARPGGWCGLAYHRLHGSPRMYRSPYSDEQVRTLAARIAHGQAAESWVIFDNTASGAALPNALALQAARSSSKA